MLGGVEIDVSAALAQTIQDINYPSYKNLEDHLLVLPLQIRAPGTLEKCFEVCLFDGLPNIL